MTPGAATRAAVALAMISAAAPAIADDLAFRLENASTSTVWEAYATPSGGARSEVDLLENDIVRPGESIDLVVPAAGEACLFDIRLVFYEGTESEDAGIDLCRLPDGTYTWTE